MIYERFQQWDIDVEKGTIYSLKHKRYIGFIDKDGYVQVGRYNNNFKQQKLHQYIWMCVNGDIPYGYDIHHIDHNPSNNSIYNLELVEHNEHTLNHNKEKKIIFIGENNPFYGKHHTDETKRKISEANKYRKVSEDTKNKMSKSHKGYKHTEETKRKISEAHKGINYFYGKHHTYESKKKISNANINNPKLSKKVAQYTLDGELVKIWDSTKECGRNGFSQSGVSLCCRGKIKEHKKFKWRYLTNEYRQHNFNSNR